MSLHGQIVITVLCVLGLVYVVVLTVSRALSEAWCLLWIGTLSAALVLANVRPLLDWITREMGARYPASALTMVAIFLLVLLAINSHREATLHSRQIAALTRQLALLRATVEAAHPDPLFTQGRSTAEACRAAETGSEGGTRRPAEEGNG
jgi:hypothetical protein